MATGKRYYWMKLKESFMNSDTVDFFMSQPNGANYVVLYQMLCLKTINTAGHLSRQIGEVIIQYDVDKIVRDCKWFSADTVRVALNLYKKFGLIYEDKGGVLVMSDYKNLVGSETDWADKKQRQRNRLPAADTSGDNVPTNVPIDKEIRGTEIRDEDKEFRSEDNRNITTTTTTTFDSNSRAYVPPPFGVVRDFFAANMDIFGVVPNHEADKFYSYNANRGWDCLPDWENAALLWISRIPDKV